MLEPENEQGRPCLHCMMVELIDDFFRLPRTGQIRSTPKRWMKLSRPSQRPWPN